jgi:hypothetical protein
MMEMLHALDLQIYLGFFWILFNNWKTMWWLPVVPLIFWIEGFFFRIDGKWSERSERPFRREFRGPPRPPEAINKKIILIRVLIAKVHSHLFC